MKFYQDLFAKARYSSPTREEYKNLFYRTMVEVIKLWVEPKSEEELMRIFMMGKNREVRHHSELITMPKGAEQTIKNTLSTQRLQRRGPTTSLFS